MKCTILHESRGRMRVHVHAVRMTLHRADVLEAYLNHQDSIHHATVYERTGDVVLIPKASLSSDWSLQPDSMKLDSLVIAHQPRRGEYVPGPCTCLLYTSPSPRDRSLSRMPSSA